MSKYAFVKYKMTVMNKNPWIYMSILSLGITCLLFWQLFNISKMYTIEHAKLMSEINKTLEYSVYELNSQLPHNDSNMIALNAETSKIAIIKENKTHIIILQDEHLLTSENRALYDIRDTNYWCLDSLYTIFNKEITENNIHTPVHFQLLDSTGSEIKTFHYGQFPSYGIIQADTIELGFLSKHKLVSFHAFPFHDFWIKSKSTLLQSCCLMIILAICLLTLHRIICEGKKWREFQELCINTLMHNLKFPLIDIIKSTYLLEKGGQNTLPSNQYKLAKGIHHQAKGLLVDIKRLLFLSMKSRKPKIESTNIDLKELFKNMNLQNLATSSQYKIINIVTCFDKNNWVVGDTNYLLITFQNIIDNAIKYSFEQVQIEITCKELKNTVRVSIKDNGIGIDTRDQKNIFKKFYRAHNQFDEQQQGYGLGLFFVYSVIKAHKGKIHIISSKNKGTEFIITLPKVKSYENQN